ncbi:MAG TPA: DHH family phosphoesterase, partial [Armatimonadota bacterium]|nr:DHH family phosphoesterase [Armatimonadota bacterium]
MDLPSIRWAICPGIPPATRALAPQLPPMLAQLLYNRGIVGAAPEILEHFLNPRWEDGLHDPFLLADMDRAVARILEAIDRHEPIGVFGHYDADGITALVLLTETLAYLNATVIPYLPNRCDDYGVNENGIAELSRQGVRLLISVDSGIRSFNAPQVAAHAGIDLIITDHHTVLRASDEDVLPPALAVINPLRADCYYP